MNFANAAILVAAIFGITQLLKSVLPEEWMKHRGVVVLMVIVSSFFAVFVVGASVWAKQQTIGGVRMDQLSVWDKVIVSIFLAGVACFGDQGLKAIRNIGQNDPTAITVPVVSLPVIDVNAPIQGNDHEVGEYDSWANIPAADEGARTIDDLTPGDQAS